MTQLRPDRSHHTVANLRFKVTELLNR